jgi:spore maturation protein CgeB
MFEPGAEILLFDRDAPEQLAEHIRRIQREPGFGAQVAERALNKVRRFHTAEQRVKQILSWVEGGTEPVYA